MWTVWSVYDKLTQMGRLISFDQAQTLETIQSAFWDNGYSATSLDDIMRSTGLGKGSLYGAYGSKHDMYLAAFTDYCDWAINDYEERLQGPDDGAIVRLQQLVKTTARCSPASRRGCMLANGTAEVAGRFPDVDKIIAKTFKALEGALAKCVLQAQRAGEIDPGSDARTVAVTLLALLRGIEALKKAGTSPASLSLVTQGAMDVLKPSKRG